MKSHIKNILKIQAGFTLIEVMIAVAIMGIIGTGIMAVISQTIKENVRNRGQMTAIQQVENAGYWVTRDTQMSQTVSPDTADSSGFPLLLEWEEWDGDEYKVTYSLIGGELQRSLVKNAETAVQTIVARSVNAGSTLTKCDYTGSRLNFTITASTDGVSETRTYSIKNRPG